MKSALEVCWIPTHDRLGQLVGVGVEGAGAEIFIAEELICTEVVIVGAAQKELIGFAYDVEGYRIFAEGRIVSEPYD